MSMFPIYCALYERNRMKSPSAYVAFRKILGFCPKTAWLA